MKNLSTVMSQTQTPSDGGTVITLTDNINIQFVLDSVNQG